MLQDVAARVRFQKYRGLKSFRTSVWDPKENLPADYARIFQFENFDRTKKRVLEEKVEGAEVSVIHFSKLYLKIPNLISLTTEYLCVCALQSLSHILMNFN